MVEFLGKLIILALDIFKVIMFHLQLLDTEVLQYQFLRIKAVKAVLEIVVVDMKEIQEEQLFS